MCGSNVCHQDSKASTQSSGFKGVDWSQSELPLVSSCLRLQLLPIIRPGRPFCKISSNSPLFESGTFSWGASSPNLTLPPHLSSQRMDWMLKSEQCDVWGCFSSIQLRSIFAKSLSPDHPVFKWSDLPAQGLNFSMQGGFLFTRAGTSGGFYAAKIAPI